MGMSNHPHIEYLNIWYNMLNAHFRFQAFSNISWPINFWKSFLAPKSEYFPFTMQLQRRFFLFPMQHFYCKWYKNWKQDGDVVYRRTTISFATLRINKSWRRNWTFGITIHQSVFTVFFNKHCQPQIWLQNIFQNRCFLGFDHPISWTLIQLISYGGRPLI